MGEAKWTEEQLLAITEKGRNLLVAAAAGAGKTAVLVERIIRKITDKMHPIDIDRLLVVTFTNAAATEMRERIGDAITKALDKNPGSKELQRQLTLLNKASITTIHSFCLEVIRNNFHCIDLDPGFRIADDTECILMKMEVLEELFDDMYEDENRTEQFLQLVECYGGTKDDRMLQDMVLSLYEFVQSCPWPEQWLDEKAEAFNLAQDEDFGSTPWAQVLLRSIKIEFSGLVAMLQRALEIAAHSEGLASYIGNFQDDITAIQQIEKSLDSGWDTICKAFSTFEFGKLTRCGKDADKASQEKVKQIRDEVKKRIKKIHEDLFTYDTNQISLDLKCIYSSIMALAELVKKFETRYTARKREKSLLDFNDLEHLCLEILTVRDSNGRMQASKVALGFKERFEEILVDEYQDSNLVQEVMLKMISREDSDAPNIFMVGDVKQSIYRFRQAKPELFMQKYRMYSSESGERNRKILLFKNFRSRGEVIHSVNYIFKQIMSENAGELDYNDNEALNLGASFEEVEDPESLAGGVVELHLLDMTDIGSEEGNDSEEEKTEVEEDAGEPVMEEEETPDAIKAEAIVVIRRIKEMLTADKEGRIFKVFDKKLNTYRKVEFKDIVILLRSTRNWAEVFVEELGNQGIPAYADSGTGYFKTMEVQVMMSLLQIIDNPMQDIPLLAVLRSSIGGFSAEELIDIRMSDRESSMVEAMKKLAETGEGTVSKKSSDFIELLKLWRERSLYMSTDELIGYLYDATGYYSYAGAMPGGIQRQANLRILFERARQYEETSYKGLFNFINFINKLKSSSGDMGSAKILGENENVVRIMSIHKSKGLEFPVVFVSGCGKGFNMQDLNRSMLVHQDLGFGPDFVDPKRRISYASIPKQALRYKTKIESLSEEMRILYVAFTRAREKLIITGAVKKLDRILGKWAACLEKNDVPQNAKLPEYEMLKARNYLDWIGPALIRHKECNHLRMFTGLDKEDFRNLIYDESIWEVRIWNRNQLVSERRNEKREEMDYVTRMKHFDFDASYSPYRNEIEKRLEWSYPYKISTGLGAKLTVTELKRLYNEHLEEINQPLYIASLVKKPKFFDGAKEFSAAEKGTILHFIMQHMDIRKAAELYEIEKQILNMVKYEQLTEQQVQTVNLRKILAFFNSSLGKRMVNADIVYREVPFNLEIPCSEIYRELESSERSEDTVLLQGVIDCYFIENNEIILVDYKTDYVAEGESYTIMDKYGIQIEYYKRALETITGMKVKEKYIYLFWNGEIISV